MATLPSEQGRGAHETIAWMEDGFAAICVWNSGRDSLELFDRAPVPPVTGSTNLTKRTTHLHLAPHMSRHLPLRDQVSAVTDMLVDHLGAFREYRHFTPFHLAIEWHYQELFELLLDLGLLRVLAALRSAVDLDLYWAGDEHYVDAVDDSQAFYYGELFVTTPPDGYARSTDARHEVGRHVVPELRHAPKGTRLELDIRGGIGRPYTHFSANAIRAAAANDSELLVTVRPTARSKAPVPS